MRSHQNFRFWFYFQFHWIHLHFFLSNVVRIRAHIHLNICVNVNFSIYIYSGMVEMLCSSHRVSICHFKPYEGDEKGKYPSKLKCKLFHDVINNNRMIGRGVYALEYQVNNIFINKMLSFFTRFNDSIVLQVILMRKNR